MRNATKEYYRKYIRKISKNKLPEEIRNHIILHAHDIEDTTRNSPHSWTASMYNLLRIYEAVHKFQSTTEEQLYKLAAKYYRHKGFTPPPGGKIPRNVKMRSVVAGSEKRLYEKQISIKQLYSLGRSGKPSWTKQDMLNKKKQINKIRKILRIKGF